jgi:serine/threonine protein kinase
MTQQLRAIKADERFFPPSEVISERFDLGEIIGKGPFGEVYRAEDTLIDAQVAVKIFDPKLIENPRHQEQFLRTSRTARTMTQTNVVRVHGSGVHKDHAWVSMQALEGLSLRKILKMRRSKGERFSLEELEPVIGQITLAVQHINREFPHGDLKPDNIIFLPELIKLTDHYLYAAIDHESFANRLSESPYIAPELHTPSQEATPRCDVYSLGVLIGEMVFGPDYTPGSPDTNVAGAAAVDVLCRRATAFDPAERYDSVEALSEDFATLVDTGRLLNTGHAGAEGASTSSPPPAPGAPASAGGADDANLLLEETPRDIAEPLEDDITTRDYDRGSDEQATSELGDLLETNEVRREELPPPPSAPGSKAPTTKNKSESTATAIKAEEKNKKDSSGLPAKFIVIGLLAVVGVIAAIFWVSGQKQGKHVELGDADKGAVGSDESSAEGLRDDASQTTQASVGELSAATGEAGQVMLAARGEAVVAAETLGTTSEGMKDVAKAVVAAKKVADEPNNEGGRADEGSQAASGASQEPSSSGASEQKPSTATNCKGGMVLVKSKRGNYCVDAYEYPARGATPTTRVSWFKAKQLCNAKGKRLCTLSEWRGACGSKYPYGRKWDPDKCNTVDEDEFERSLTTAGSFGSCRSWTGAYDMTGNAHEWVAEQRIAGGGFDSGPEVASCRYSSAKAAGSSSSNIGFRCCANAE